MKLTTLVLCLLVALASGYAQDISTASLQWTVSHLTDLNTNKSQAYQCTFNTHGNQDIVWIQKDNYSRTFTVTGMQGSWANVKTMGKVEFQIEEEGEMGTLVFERTSSGVVITINKSQGNLITLRQRFTVTSITNN